MRNIIKTRELTQIRMINHDLTKIKGIELE